MASWNIPALVNKISEDVPAIKALLTALFKWTDDNTTDVPVGAKRLQEVAGGKQMQEYSGSAWGNIGKLMHDVDMLDGKHASTAQTADTIPVRDANGTIPGNISGNAATATSAYGLDSGYTVPVSNGGTGATSEAGARASLGADNASNISSGILDIAYGGTGSSTKNFVDLTNNQNVGGTKTFSSNLAFSGDNFLEKTLSGIANTDTTRGQRSTFVICKITDSANKLFAGFEASAETDGSRRIYTNMRNRADSGWIDGPMLKELADGTVQHLAKTPPAAANDTQIATTAWVRDATVARATGDADGNNIKNTYLKLAGGTMTGNLEQKFTSYERGKSTTAYTRELIDVKDKNNVRFALLETTVAADKSSKTCIFAYNTTATSGSNIGSIAIGCTSSGDVYTVAPTPANNDRSTKIATTAYIGNCVVPANTRMVFQQSAAPTGWTKETGSGYNNTALRFVTGNIGNKTDGKAFTTCMATGRGTTSVTQGGTISKTTAGGTVGNKALSVAMLAKHRHEQWSGNYGDSGGAPAAGYGTTTKSSNTEYTGSGSNHNHGFTGTEHGHTFTGSAHSHKLDLDVNYIDCIIAKKN